MTCTRTWLRWGLSVLAAIQAGTGSWMALGPRSFYDGVLGVSALPPYNEHLMRDISGLYLALAVVLASSAIHLQRTLVRTALSAYLVVSVTHLAFHASHGAGLPASSTVVLLGVQVLLVLGPAGLLILAMRPHEPGP